MEDKEKASHNVNASDIISKVLKEVGLNAPTFAKTIGINYQRVFDLQNGRTKKFNPGIVNKICEVYPQINKSFLYSGEGSLTVDPPAEKQEHSTNINELVVMLKKVTELFQKVMDKDEEVQQRLMLVQEKERELHQREMELDKREMELNKKN